MQAVGPEHALVCFVDMYFRGCEMRDQLTMNRTQVSIDLLGHLCPDQ